jgi:hypothetical protein
LPRTFQEIDMDETRAIAIVSALADGVNPATGEVFPADSPYQSADIVRALYMARRALEARPTTRLRNQGAPNAGKPWTREHDQTLLEAFDQGSTLQELAEALGRTIAGIEVRLVKHGRLAPSNGAGAPPWRRAATPPPV